MFGLNHMKGRLQAEIGRGQDVSTWKDITSKHLSDFDPKKAAKHDIVLPESETIKVGEAVPEKNARQIIIGTLNTYRVRHNW